MKKAIFFDVDGTILDCFGGITEIRPKVKEAIRSLQKAGHYVFIASGRPYAFLSKTILDFGFDGFVLMNGSKVILNGESIYSDPMDKDFVKYVVSKFDEHKMEYILESDHYSYIKESHKEFLKFYGSIGISHKLLESNYNLENIDVHKIEMLCLDEESENMCLDLVRNNPDYDHYYSISAKNFELYAKKNTKASGIIKALEILNIPIENSYAFGDGNNDIEMLSTVGCGIAMGNASDEVKGHAKVVTDTVQNDGVASGIEKYILV